MSAENRDEVYQIRAIYLKSDQYQLIGKSDLIEFENGDYYPIEYKRGRKGEWDNDELQVCAQALCLEEMTGKNINSGYIYYAQTHQRQLVEITPELRSNTIATIEAVKMLLFTGAMPKSVKTKRCDGCSLFARCLPQAVDKVGRYQEAS
jgi:CRISPR-associated exonuclease Cas4